MLKGIISGEEKNIISIPMKGKNLLKIADSASTTINGVSWSIDNGVVIGTGVTTHPEYQDTILLTEVGIIRQGNYPTYLIISSSRDRHIKPGTYTFSVTAIAEPTGSTSKISIIVGHDGSSVKSYTAIRVFNGDTFTVSDNDTYYALVINTTKSCDYYEYKNIMLNEGSTALPYEPYGYQNGWEIRDNQNKLIWGREDELQTITGTLSFKGYSLPVKVKSLLGNTVQNGTPDPDNPIIPEFVGVGTENLFDPSTATLGKYISSQGIETNSTAPTPIQALNHTDYIEIQPNTDYIYHYKYIEGVANTIALCWFDTSKSLISRDTKNVNYQNIDYTLTATSPANAAFCIINFTGYLPNGSMQLSFNFGSTVLPYEPYGYKIPFNNNGENLWANRGFSANAIGLNYTHNISNNYGTTLSTTTGNEVTITQSAYPTGDVSYQNGFFMIDVDFSKYAVGSIVAISFDYIVNEVHALSSQISTTLYVGSSSNYVQPTLSSGNWNISGRLTAVITIIDGMNPYVEVRLCGNSITVKNIMLNIGSTALPYSPYLNKTTPVYLGQIPTIRRIKKLVLTGNEAWQLLNGNYFSTVIDRKGAKATILCTHFINSNAQGISYDRVSIAGLKIASVAVPFVSSVNDLKAWLAAQYSAGTSVTVWYVLATPETAIVNEPLAKIGDYADELNSTNAEISIQTTDGINTLDVNTDLKPSYLSLTGHIKQWQGYILKDVDGYILKDVDGYILNVKE